MVRRRLRPIVPVAALLTIAAPSWAQHRFQSGSAVSIAAAGQAAPYPSTVAVSGVRRAVQNVTVTLSGLSHTFPADLDVVLVGPRGQACVLVSDCGGDTDLLGVSLVFGDASPLFLPAATPIVSGFYHPTDSVPGDPIPGVGSPVNTSLSVFNGTDPNGLWSLYVFDDKAGDSGALAGWSVSITEVGSGDITVAGVSPVAIADDSTTQLAPLVVSGIEGPVRALRVRLMGLSHAFASDLDVVLTDPLGQTCMLMSDCGGATPLVNADLLFDDGAALPVPAGAIASGLYRPTNRLDAQPDPFAIADTLSIFDGLDANGTWTLAITDDAAPDPGSIVGWSLTFRGLCRADFDQDGAAGILDIFAFLSAWFAGCP